MNKEFPAKQKTRFFIGTSGWTYPEWKGVFYPARLAQKRWFEHYAGVFNAVEINATFYRFFADSTYEKWRAQAPAGFRYALKAPRYITHRKRLVEAEKEIGEFSRSAFLLHDALGAILLQLAPRIAYDPARLRAALRSFADPRKVAVEFRDEKWQTEEIRNLLAEAGAIFCNSDSPKSRCLEWVTSSSAYLRLHGRRRWYDDEYTEAELRSIGESCARMAEAGAETVYVFFNNDCRGYAPRNASALKEMLGSAS